MRTPKSSPALHTAPSHLSWEVSELQYIFVVNFRHTYWCPSLIDTDSEWKVERSHPEANTGKLWWQFVNVCPSLFGAWKIVGVWYMLYGVYVLQNFEMGLNSRKKMQFLIPFCMKFIREFGGYLNKYLWKNGKWFLVNIIWTWNVKVWETWAAVPCGTGWHTVTVAFVTLNNYESNQQNATI
jgi:hypothetical protein